MSYHEWRPYVPVADRRRKAAIKLAKPKLNGSVFPVTIAGRAIAKSFWGKSWCTNLERYSDYENRLPRGRTYVRNGSVFNLQIAKSKDINNSQRLRSLYNEDHHRTRHGDTLKGHLPDCAGTIDSIIK